MMNSVGAWFQIYIINYQYQVVTDILIAPVPLAGISEICADAQF